MTVSEVEEAVEKLIEHKKIDARINSRDKILRVNPTPDRRQLSLNKVNQLGEMFMIETQSMLLRK